jgi:hypothetical protein
MFFLMYEVGALHHGPCSYRIMNRYLDVFGLLDVCDTIDGLYIDKLFG